MRWRRHGSRMKPVDCVARAQGDIEAEFVEFSSKAGPVDAMEVIPAHRRSDLRQA
mgnify:CR=1 FL=1